MKHNTQRRPEEIEADIERTRGHLDATLSAIERRLNPSELLDRGLNYLRHNGVREYAQSLGNAARQDPLPLALVGVGLAWLMVSIRRNHEPHADTLQGQAGTAASRTKEKLVAASESISHTAQAARERAGQIGQTARQGAERIRGGYAHVVQEQPLALGAVGMAVGAVLAASAPRTSSEDRLAGELSDRLADDAKDAARAGIDQVKQAAAPADVARDGDRESGDAREHASNGRAGDARDKPVVQPYAPYAPPSAP